MRIKTKFIIALILLVLLPAIFTLLITNNFLSDNLNYVHFFDTYYDIFDNFSNISMAFEEAVNPYTNSPEYFLTTPFKQLALSDFSTAYLSVEVSQNGIVRFTTFSDEIQDLSWIEQLLYKNLSQEYIGVQYSLKHHQIGRASWRETV